MDSKDAILSGAGSSPTRSTYKRKRSGAEFESSPGSQGECDDDDGERRRQPGVKRACNECRQQKVSHRRLALGGGINAQIFL